jgi:hypothetical protein
MTRYRRLAQNMSNIRSTFFSKQNSCTCEKKKAIDRHKEKVGGLRFPILPKLTIALIFKCRLCFYLVRSASGIRSARCSVKLVDGWSVTVGAHRRITASPLLGRPPTSPFGGGVAAAAFVVKHMAIEPGALMVKKMRHGKRSTAVKTESSPGDPDLQVANPAPP